MTSKDVDERSRSSAHGRASARNGAPADQVLFRWSVLEQDSSGAERWRLLRRWMSAEEAAAWAAAQHKTLRRVDFGDA